ncbi:MAG: AMP-binding protein [Planctomycetes bacterium]|nr:AMP-binding protein [Planctomycetota bacterium]
MYSSVQEAFLRAAADFPDKPAVVGTERTLTYREYAAAALSVAAALEERGEDECVAFLLPTSQAFALMYFGTLLSGRIPVPLNFFLAPEELSHIIGDCKAKSVFTVKFFKKTARTLPAETVLAEEFIPAALSQSPAAAKTANRTATILYTSGTTGAPKGVVLSQENVLSNVEGCIEHFGFDSHHRVLSILPLFHTFALTTTLALPAVAGATAVLAERFDSGRAVRAIQEHSITTVVAVPSMYRAMLRSLEKADADLSSLELPISGGEPLGEECFDVYRDRHSVTLLEGYGLTETSPVISANTPQAMKPHTVGRPLANLEVRVADAAGQDAGINVDGEIWVRGPSVMVGYLNLPEESRKAMTGNGFFRTGDMGRIDYEGYLRITGRIKEMIISAGENVFPGEVERVLAKHPGVVEAAVIGVPEKLRGEAPKAFVILLEGAETTQEDLKAFCREHIAHYKVPVAVEFREEFPRGPTGKVLKQRLVQDVGGRHKDTR